MTVSDPFGFNAAINWDALDALENEVLLAEHAFQPGDGEFARTDVCQFPGCGHWLSEHEEGEPCCYPFFSTRGQHHAYDCDSYDG